MGSGFSKVRVPVFQKVQVWAWVHFIKYAVFNGFKINVLLEQKLIN